MSRFAVRVATSVLVLLVAGCTETAPIPEPSPTPVPRVPVAGMCFEYWRPWPRPASGLRRCDEPHRGEVLAVRDGVPSGPRSMADASADCRRQADAYLGGPWWQQRVDVVVELPDERERAAGASWYRCDLYELAQLSLHGDSSALHKSRSAPMSVPAASELRLVRCAQLDVDEMSQGVLSVMELDCEQRHNAELVGFVEGPDDWGFPSTTRLAGREIRKKFSALCRSSIPGLGGTRPAYDVWVIPVAGESGWKQGRRGVRCFAGIRGRSLTGPLHR